MAACCPPFRWFRGHGLGRALPYSVAKWGSTEAEMRRLLHFDNHGANVAEVLTAFNGHRESLGMGESDVVSVSVLPPEPEYVMNLRFAEPSPNVRVLVIYWA